jgi:hypothetical protein
MKEGENNSLTSRKIENNRFKDKRRMNLRKRTD